MKKILISIFLILFCVLPVWSGEFEDTKKSAEQGNMNAQRNLGLIYIEGNLVSQDFEKSLYWFKKASEQGDEMSMGVMYESGEGVQQNYKQALYWFKKASEQGYAKSQYSLGDMYDNGIGTPQNYKQAAYWYKKSAEQGYDKAQWNLGDMYYNGKGVSRNYKQAYIWYSLSVSQGNSDAIESREKAAKELTPKQINKAQEASSKIQYKIDNPSK